MTEDDLFQRRLQEKMKQGAWESGKAEEIDHKYEAQEQFKKDLQVAKDACDAMCPKLEPKHIARLTQRLQGRHMDGPMRIEIEPEFGSVRVIFTDGASVEGWWRYDNLLEAVAELYRWIGEDDCEHWPGEWTRAHHVNDPVSLERRQEPDLVWMRAWCSWCQWGCDEKEWSEEDGLCKFCNREMDVVCA